MNIESATINGFELGTTFDIGEHFDLDFKLEPYFHWTHLIRSTNNVKHEDLANRAKDTVSFGIDFSYEPASFDASINGVRHGKMRTKTGTEPWKSVKSAVVFDVNIKKGLYTTEDYGRVNLKVNLKNIFNKTYTRTTTEEGFDDFMPGRSFYVALEYAF
jgi:outer membrane receptor protein involved in Fe transport